MAFEELFKKYDRLMIFDTETTGLHPNRDQIIEFSAVIIEKKKGIVQTFDELIALEPGTRIPDNIVQLTGITNEAVAASNFTKRHLAAHLGRWLEKNTLMIAYNAQFDLCFVYYLLHKVCYDWILQGKDKLDLLTVYKDRRSYPHKLKNAIEAYGLSDKVVNSHRAIDDVLATVEVMKAMEAEKNDLLRYVNLFGYNPNYPKPRPSIRSVTYKPQPYDPIAPLYEG